MMANLHNPQALRVLLSEVPGPFAAPNYAECYHCKQMVEIIKCRKFGHQLIYKGKYATLGEAFELFGFSYTDIDLTYYMYAYVCEECVNRLKMGLKCFVELQVVIDDLRIRKEHGSHVKFVEPKTTEKITNLPIVKTRIVSSTQTRDASVNTEPCGKILEILNLMRPKRREDLIRSQSYSISKGTVDNSRHGLAPALLPRNDGSSISTLLPMNDSGQMVGNDADVQGCPNDIVPSEMSYDSQHGQALIMSPENDSDRDTNGNVTGGDMQECSSDISLSEKGNDGQIDQISKVLLRWDSRQVSQEVDSVTQHGLDSMSLPRNDKTGQEEGTCADVMDTDSDKSHVQTNLDMHLVLNIQNIVEQIYKEHTSSEKVASNRDCLKAEVQQKVDLEYCTIEKNNSTSETFSTNGGEQLVISERWSGKDEHFVESGQNAYGNDRQNCSDTIHCVSGISSGDNIESFVDNVTEEVYPVLLLQKADVVQNEVCAGSSDKPDILFEEDGLRVCNVCDQKFANIQNLKRHQIRNHLQVEDKIFVCDLCDHRFINMANLRRHQHRQHLRGVHSKYGKIENTKRCLYCGIRFTALGMKEHSKEGCLQRKGTKIRYKCKKRFFDCKACISSRAFRSLESFSSHLQIHIEQAGQEKFHTYSICHKEHINGYQLERISRAPNKFQMLVKIDREICQDIKEQAKNGSSSSSERQKGMESTSKDRGESTEEETPNQNSKKDEIAVQGYKTAENDKNEQQDLDS